MPNIVIYRFQFDQPQKEGEYDRIQSHARWVFGHFMKSLYSDDEEAGPNALSNNSNLLLVMFVILALIGIF